MKCALYLYRNRRRGDGGGGEQSGRGGRQCTQPKLVLSGQRKSDAGQAREHKTCATVTNLVAQGGRKPAPTGAGEVQARANWRRGGTGEAQGRASQILQIKKSVAEQV